MELSYELKIAEDLALKAGKMALDLRPRLTFTEKPNDEGPVTNVDILIDKFICQNLSQIFPTDRIVSEESYSDDQGPLLSGRTWLIDPIDGTTSYIIGTDDFVVMIGLAIDGVAHLGVVYQPTHGKLWRGIWGNGEQSTAELVQKETKRSLSLKPPLRNEELTLIASRTHRSKRQDRMIKAIKPKKILYRSSIGLKAMMILEGVADFYVAWSKRIKLWDTCAPSAIALAAGAIISFIDGKPLLYRGPIFHQGPIMFANFNPSKQLMSIVMEIAKE